MEKEAGKKVGASVWRVLKAMLRDMIFPLEGTIFTEFGDVKSRLKTQCLNMNSEFCFPKLVIFFKLLTDFSVALVTEPLATAFSLIRTVT